MAVQRGCWDLRRAISRGVYLFLFSLTQRQLEFLIIRGDITISLSLWPMKAVSAFSLTQTQISVKSNTIQHRLEDAFRRLHGFSTMVEPGEWTQGWERERESEKETAASGVSCRGAFHSLLSIATYRESYASGLSVLAWGSFRSWKTRKTFLASCTGQTVQSLRPEFAVVIGAETKKKILLRHLRGTFYTRWGLG